jgi:hypothetical protein
MYSSDLSEHLVKLVYDENRLYLERYKEHFKEEETTHVNTRKKFDPFLNEFNTENINSIIDQVAKRTTLELNLFSYICFLIKEQYSLQKIIELAGGSRQKVTAIYGIIQKHIFR